MSGFKNFLLRGNLIELAVAFIMASAFAAVVTATVALIMDLIGYFVVLPYTKAKERFFPSEDKGTPADVALLEEIRDLLRARNGQV